MRNLTIVENNKRKKYRQLFITLLVATIGFLAIFIMLCVMSAGLNYSNVKQVDGILQTVEEQEESLSFTINNDQYTMNSIVLGQVDSQQILGLQGQEVVIYLLDDEVIGIESEVYSLSGEEGFGLIKDNYNISMIIIGVLTGVLLIGTIVFLIKYLTAKKMVAINVFKLLGNRMVAISQERKHYLKFAMIPLIIALVLLIPMVIYSEPVGTLFYVFLGLFLAFILCGIILTAVFMPIIKKKEIEQTNSYFDFKDNKHEYNSYVLDEGNQLVLKLQEDGLLYKSEFEADFIIETFKNDEAFSGQDVLKLRGELLKEINSNSKTEGESYLEENQLINYDELNLSTKVVFRPANEPMKIYISSNLKLTQLPTLNNDIFIELNEDLYYFIQKYNIKVDGLDTCLHMRKEYMEKYCNGKTKFVEVDATGEHELFKK